MNVFCVFYHKAMSEKLIENHSNSSKWTKKELFISGTFCLAMISMGSYFTLPSLSYPQEVRNQLTPVELNCRAL